MQPATQGVATPAPMAPNQQPRVPSTHSQAEMDLQGRRQIWGRLGLYGHGCASAAVPHDHPTVADIASAVAQIGPFLAPPDEVF